MTPAVQAAIDTLTPYAQSMEAEELNFATSADVALRVMRAVDNPGRQSRGSCAYRHGRTIAVCKGHAHG
jgi:hypothetical protein